MHTTPLSSMISAIPLFQFFSLSYVQNPKLSSKERTLYALFEKYNNSKELERISPPRISMFKYTLIHDFSIATSFCLICVIQGVMYHFHPLPHCLFLPASGALFFQIFAFLVFFTIRGIFKVMSSSCLLVDKFVILFIFPIIQLLWTCVIPER